MQEVLSFILALCKELKMKLPMEKIQVESLNHVIHQMFVRA